MMKRFNIRAYGIYIRDHEVLVTDEFRMGIRMTKFPGGGLEFGEGLADCVLRECVEEFGQEFRILRHYYTTDFFQPSAFDPSHQLVSVYYLLEPLTELACRITVSPFSFLKEEEGAQSFRFIPLDKLDESHFTFPVDKVVAQMLKDDHQVIQENKR